MPKPIQYVATFPAKPADEADILELGSAPVLDLAPAREDVIDLGTPAAAAAPAQPDDIGFGRAEDRFQTSWLIVIALPGGANVHATARDVSKSGARLAVPSSVPLPEVFSFKVVGKDFVVRARRVWRRGDNVGIVVERTATLPIPPAAKPAPSKGPQGRLYAKPLVTRQ